MIKTRFAPSPTGYLHVGGLRILFYCYLHAKQSDGTFLLRIEDTDQSRLKEGSVENLLTTLEKLGLTPDEGPHSDLGNGPYYQSKRLPIYKEYVQKMLDNGSAYYCFCTKERLDELRSEQEIAKLPTKYDGHCLGLTSEEIQAKLESGEKYTIRLKVPKGKELIFDDQIRGKIKYSTNDTDDQVLMKADGFPTYHLAVVVDDYLMKVSDVFRGEEWLPSMPKQILIADALDIELPKYSHQPLLLGIDKKKLSKRTGDVAVEKYLERGYLVEGILNYIALLGWNPKTTDEIFTLEELIEKFNIKQIHKSGAVFDESKLEWINTQHIKKLDTKVLFNKLVSYLKEYKKDFYEKVFSDYSDEYNLSIIKELQTKIKRFDEFEGLTGFFYDKYSPNTEFLINEKMKIDSMEIVKKALNIGLDVLKGLNDEELTLENLRDIFIEKIKEDGMKNGQVLWPIRVALSGEQFSPGAFELIQILKKDMSIERIKKTLQNI